MRCTECVSRASAILAKKGIASARREALMLMESLFGLSRQQVYANPSLALSDEAERLYVAAARLRGSRLPLQYITGNAPFFGLDFHVECGVFIPRPETETLVEVALRLAGEMVGRQLEVLDIGTGCGNIAVALAVNEGRARVTAVDVCPRALRVAEMNVLKYGVASRVRLLASDVYSALIPGRDSFDMIVSNPPYIPENELGSLDTEVRVFEPREALDGGHGGLELITKIIGSAGSFLRDGGYVILEVDPRQADRVAGVLLRGWERAMVWQDLSGRKRVVSARKPGMA